jgi:hypothetical protein
MAILAACLPTLRPLALKFIPGFGSATNEQCPPNSNGYIRQGKAQDSTWVSSKISRTFKGKGTVSTEAESTENLRDSMYNLEILPSNRITMDREYIVETARAI